MNGRLVSLFLIVGTLIRIGLMEKFLVFIPYVNRRDLLSEALLSIQDLWPQTIIIDNSNPVELNQGDLPGKLITPPVPLGFSQTQNYMQRIAFEKDLEFFFFMHSDASCEAGDGRRFVEHAESLRSKKWGVIFTAYDAFCCFNVEAVKAAGEWDWRGLPWYFADSDYYRRLKLAGYSHEHLNLKITHLPSQTRASDRNIERIILAQIKAFQAYYQAKWGGPPEHEVFTVPFNGEQAGAPDSSTGASE